MFVTPALPSDGAKFNEEAAEIEQFRARHRRMCRGQQQSATTTSNIEALDVDDGRTRKISAKWRLKQQYHSHNHDAMWPRSSTDSDMDRGFNAFDFSSSPEAFYDEPKETNVLLVEDEEEKSRQHMAEVAKQVTAMGFNSASLWEQSFPGLRQPGGPILQLPAFGQDSMAQIMWRPPMHYVTHDDQCRALYQQPQHHS